MLPYVPRWRPRTLALVGAAAVALLALPALVSSPYVLHVLVLLLVAVAQGESWNILGGYTGQYSVGHAAYFGLGAYVTVILLQSRQMPPWVGAWVAVGVAVLAGLVIGSITFRLRGPYFTLASIAVAEIFRLGALTWKSVTNGAEGIVVADLPPLQLGGWTVTDFGSKVPFYYLGLALVAATIFANWWVQHSKLGYCFQAIREDQDAAYSLGISLPLYKNIALGLSVVFTSLTGAFYGLYVGFVDPATLISTDVSIQFMLICIIGGIGTIAGPVVGALVLVPLSEALRSNLITDALVGSGLVEETSRTGLFLREHLAHAHALIYGLLVIATILFMPEGVLGFARKLLTRRRATAAAAQPLQGEA
jgi:branched-chain amino acid transport system permease protein